MDVKFLRGTRAEYTALKVKDSKVFYYLTDEDRLYIGTKELTTEASLVSAVEKLDGDASVVGSVKNLIAEAKAEVVNTLTQGDASVTVAGTATAKTVKVNISEETGNNLSLKEDGLYVNVPEGTDYSVTVTESTPEGYAKAYTFKQKGETIATVNIPKDMVVESGEVVKNPEGQPEGTYIKLVLANAEESVLYINVTDLIEYVTAGEDTATIHVMISDDHKVTANVIAGSIGTTELAASVVASLGKADSALQSEDIETGSENGTISVDGTDVAVKGLDSAAYAKTTDFDAAGAAAAVKGQSGDAASAETVYGAKAYADSLAVNYATAAQGALADSAVQSVTEGATNGTIDVDGTEVSVHGLKSAAYTESSAYATAAQGTTADACAAALTWQTIA